LSNQIKSSVTFTRYCATDGNNLSYVSAVLMFYCFRYITNMYLANSFVSFRSTVEARVQLLPYKLFTVSFRL